MDRSRFHVLRIDPVITNLRVGHCDDLTRIGGIGEDFLVTCQGGVEDDFTSRLKRRSKQTSPKIEAVAQNQQTVGHGELIENVEIVEVEVLVFKGNILQTEERLAHKGCGNAIGFRMFQLQMRGARFSRLVPSSDERLMATVGRADQPKGTNFTAQGTSGKLSAVAHHHHLLPLGGKQDGRGGTGGHPPQAEQQQSKME